MSVAYQKLHERYRAACKAGPDAKPGEGRTDKAKIMGEIRQMERDGAREGRILSAVYKGDAVVVETKQADSKRSLQEEYVRKFDAEKTVMLGGKEQTLREYHSKRLLNR